MLVETYGEHSLGITQCKEWFKKFRNGNYDVENKTRENAPKKFQDAELQALLDEDDTHTQEELAEQLQVTQAAVSMRLKGMGLIQKLSKFFWLILLHDNAPSHTALVVKNTIDELQWETLPHPAYSPDLAPSDYHLFSSMENALKQQQFTSFENVQNWIENFFGQKTKDFYRAGIRNLPDRWAKCVTKEGDYFE